MELPNGSRDLSVVLVTVTMLGGLYRGGSFTFRIDIPTSYPFHGACLSNLPPFPFACLLRAPPTLAAGSSHVLPPPI